MDGMQYRMMLAELARNMRENDLKAMKFMSADIIPRRRQEEICTAFDLWEALDERDKLGPNNLDFLHHLLESCTENRTDLLAVYQKYLGTDTRHVRHGAPGPIHISQQALQVSPNHADAEFGPDLSKEFDYLMDNLGRNWRTLARRLGLSENDLECIAEDNIRNLREQCRQSLDLWKRRRKGHASRKELLQALRSCQLNLYADQLVTLS